MPVRFSGLFDDDDLYPGEHISHRFLRERHLLAAYGTAGFYDLWSRNRKEPELNKPHMGVAVCDASRSNPATLASEVAAAIAVLKSRFRCGYFIDFHTLPVSTFFPLLRGGSWLNEDQVIVYSFHHDESARITQVYWDGNGLVLRHSRLLNLRGDQPTSDAYLLIRWLANKPVGETAYQVAQDTMGLGTDEKPRPDCATRWDISVGA